jgi:hypothetical protein
MGRGVFVTSSVMVVVEEEVIVLSDMSTMVS